MELERGNLISRTPEAPVIEGDMVTAIRELTNRGWGVKTIARELGIAKNTVRRYRRHPVVAVDRVGFDQLFLQQERQGVVGRIETEGFAEGVGDG